HTRSTRDWSSDVCSSDLGGADAGHLQEVRDPHVLEVVVRVHVHHDRPLRGHGARGGREEERGEERADDEDQDGTDRGGTHGDRRWSGRLFQRSDEAFAARNRSAAVRRAWTRTPIPARAAAPPSSRSTTTATSETSAPWPRTRSIAFTRVPPVVTTSSTKSRRSPRWRSPSNSFEVPCSFRSFRTMMNGVPVSKATAAATGPAPSSTPAIRSAPLANGARPRAISRRISGRVIARLMSAEKGARFPLA